MTAKTWGPADGEPEREDHAAIRVIGPGELLKTGRMLCLVGAIAYPMFWFADRAAGVPVLEPLWLRLLLALPLPLVLAASYRSGWVQRHITALLLAQVYVITTHAFALVIANQLRPSVVQSIYVVLAGFIAVSTYTTTSLRQVGLFLGYVALCGLVAVLTVTQPETSVGHVTISVATICALAYVTVRGHLLTMRRLAASRHELRADIARRRTTEQALRDSESRSRALIQALPDVLVVLHPTGRVLEVWNAEVNDLGAAAAGLAGGEAPFWRLFSEVDGRGVRTAIGRAIDTRGPQVFECTASSGSASRQIECRAVATQKDDVVVLLRDVSNERAMEQKLRATDRLIALGTLASGVAHEINNPLSYVLGNIDFVLGELRGREPGKPIPADHLDALAEAREGCERIKNIVRDLKDQSRADDQPAGPVDVNHAVQTALRVIDNQIRHRARLELSLGELGQARAHNGRLVQVVMNLLSNAIDALPERPIEQNLIGVSTRTGDDRQLVIEVRDNGTGMPAHVQGRIFDPFFTTKPQGQGTGLGLYLCHRLVTGFGGRIDVDSEPGRGTCMRVTLAPAYGPVSGVRSTAPAPLLRRVLVIDDEVAVARSIARTLQGYEVDLAHDADGALAMCSRADYDLLICDLMLPGKNGARFHEDLGRARPDLAQRLVFVTGGAFTQTMESFIASVAAPCLLKPFDRQDLFRVLEARRARNLRNTPLAGRVSRP